MVMLLQPIRRYQFWIYTKFCAPRTKDSSWQRRELVLNVTLLGLCIFASLALLVPIYNLIFNGTHHYAASIISSAVVCAILYALLAASRRGYSKSVAYVLIVLLGLVVTQMTLVWSFELPIAELAYALVIVIAGVILSTRAALVTSGLTSLIIIILSWLQSNHTLHPRTDWTQQPFIAQDAIGYVIIFGMIGMISWLANREIDRSLKQAIVSKQALLAERDKLEVTVKERTRQLEAAQLAQLLEVQRFAEFGRIGGGLIHEVANPLTAALLNLEQLHNTQQSALVRRAQDNLLHLERYLQAARKQLRDHGTVARFSVTDELDQVIEILGHKATVNNVKIETTYDKTYKLYGDAVKFSQLAANLISNAIEAYQTVKRQNAKRLVKVHLSNSGSTLLLEVHDHGKGISSKQMPHIFETFYSTKVSDDRGLGIGLAIAKDFAEHNFRGHLEASSTTDGGTVFRAFLNDWQD